MQCLGTIQLRPAIQRGRLVKIELPLALGGIGHVRHQIDGARFERLKAFLPFARDKFQLPVFARGDLLQQIDQNTVRLAGVVGEQLGFVLIQPDPHFLRASLPGQQKECQQRRAQYQIEKRKAPHELISLIKIAIYY